MARKAKAPAIEGKRVGTKKKDTRWLAPDGTVWASRFEYAVYKTLKDKGYDVRKTTEQDCMAYSSVVSNGRCRKCGATDVASERHYTPDLFVVPRRQTATLTRDPTDPTRYGYYLEVKGNLRAEKRTLLRSFRKTGPVCDLRLVVQRDFRVTAKVGLIQWIQQYMNCPAAEWNSSDPASTLDKLDTQRQTMDDAPDGRLLRGTKRGTKKSRDTASCSTSGTPEAVEWDST